MPIKPLISQLLMLVFFSFASVNLMAQADLDAGKKLFKANCAVCHNKNMKGKSTGPALGGTQERWEGKEDVLYAWIRNSAAVIASGDAYAVKMFNDNNKTPMSAFPNLTDDDIVNLLGYIKGVNDGVYPVKKIAAGPVAVGPAPPKDHTLMWAVLAGILGILAIALAKFTSNLNYIAQVKDGVTNIEKKGLIDILTGRGVVSFVIFAIIVLGGYTTVTSAINFGRQQNYQPEQPIKFSHLTHAGDQQIDCKYCHDGARRSKHSVIPAANTCMNCHKAITKGSTYGTAELTKIFASIGFDPSKGTYIEDYENKSEEEYADIYKKWIKDSFMEDNEDKSASDAVAAADMQWKDIVSSMTNDQKKKVQGPIEWIRVHNLPDHVYYNHSQHVTVGKLECQTCHGPVEKMEVVRQYAPLSMGWCISCHKETDVQFADNEYYKTYARFNEELKAGKRSGVTVEEIGGLECQKCHY